MATEKDVKLKVKLITTVTALIAVTKNPLTNSKQSIIPDLCAKKGIHNSKIQHE